MNASKMHYQHFVPRAFSEKVESICGSKMRPDQEARAHSAIRISLNARQWSDSDICLPAQHPPVQMSESQGPLATY
jgi:hypothetical protein